MTNISPRTRLADEQLEKLNKSNCRLAVYLSPSRVSWSILDTIHHKVVSVTDYVFEKGSTVFWWEIGRKLMDDSGLGAQSFGSVVVGIDCGKSMLVPQELFIESEMKTYLDFGLSLPEEPVRDFIKNIPASNIYSIPNGMPESLRRMFEKFETVHVSTPFIENILLENKNHADNKIFACIAGNVLHLAALDAGKFSFYNSFEIRTKEDFAYYLMAVTEEMNFHPEQIGISLSGDITPDSDYYQTARRFLKQLSFASRPKSLKYSARLDNIPKHLFALLYSIHLCG